MEREITSFLFSNSTVNETNSHTHTHTGARAHPGLVLSQRKVAILHVALSVSMSVLPRVTTREPLFMKFGIGAVTAICVLILLMVRVGQE